MDFIAQRCYPESMGRLFFLTIFMSAILAVSAGISSAQERDYSDVPDKYIKEAQQVYKECRKNRTRQLYYDCKCFAMRFIDERMDAGPVPSISSIALALQGECRDATEAAGAEYAQCLRGYNNMQPGTDPEEYCECYANTFVRLVDEQAPMLESKTLVPLKTQANIMCRDPALARRLYRRPGLGGSSIRITP